MSTTLICEAIVGRQRLAIDLAVYPKISLVPVHFIFDIQRVP